MLNYTSLGVLFCRFVLGPLLLVSGCNKLSARADFEKTLFYTFNVPRRLSALIARYLPVVEIVVGMCVLAGLQARVAAIATAVLLGLFCGKLLQLYLGEAETNLWMFRKGRAGTLHVRTHRKKQFAIASGCCDRNWPW